ncbi:DUF4232 domain-containing protein [Frankia sp. CNm7]|uniref:DUF4232 domain-containing protein n=1 Tax=Frankia nepalensis TaxID=1836974 RepID=A0A937RL64_9ACTN|nr:DUF4232 domain-containing protein [Frankia nepalensis]MBL7497519.1 DUF4232 domain-containing protein [Frankia nepalensis]MBL7510214.1 DUF4232 domain-containing protein [Frankia nepalensis]MBL7518983.1 DUF4232 domain-containing protein [Frankia nepalensis]MBL7630925.1 DUF4232 domain-containing protein [Frankia nepalensis]
MRTDLVWAPTHRRAAGAPHAGRIRAVGVTLAACGLLAAGSGCASTVGNEDATAVTAGSSGAAPAGPAGASAAGGPAAAGGAEATGGPALPTVPPSVLANAPVCAAETLTGAMEDAEGAAGQVYGRLVLTNTGAAACKLVGFPDVQFIDAAGAALGAPAEQDTDRGTPAPVLLAPEGKAAAVLRITQPGIQDGCLATDSTKPATALRVTPPDGSAAVSVALAGGITACVSPDVHQLLVGPLAA